MTSCQQSLWLCVISPWIKVILDTLYAVLTPFMHHTNHTTVISWGVMEKIEVI
jgi:hypothetical protein